MPEVTRFYGIVVKLFFGDLRWFKNMNSPKIHAVHATENYQLLVEFENYEKRQYDVKPLLNNEMFADLKNVAFFKNVKVEQGGYAVSWNDDIDISQYELWRNGSIVR
jgi:hypothetical protein